MRAVRRMALGLTLALGLVGSTWTAMSGCSLDWRVPEPALDAPSETSPPDGASDHADDPATDPVVDVVIDADIDAMDGAFDAIPGDAVVPCMAQPTCHDCVQCVLAEMSTVGTAMDCKWFGACMLICLVNHDFLGCLEYCGESYPAGRQVRMAIDGTCLGACSGSAPCE